MDESSRAVRQMLQGMAPSRSIPYIQSFQLPEDEELVLILFDCKKKSLQQIAMQTHMSVESVKRRRRAAIRKIYNATFL